MALSERLFAAGLEQLSGSVGQIRADANGRLAHLEERLAGTEKATRFNTDALDHVLEKMDSAANQRARDQVQVQHRAAQTDQKFNRLEDAVARLELNRPDGTVERRLDAIERALNDAGDWFRRNEPMAQFGTAIQALSHRLEALEQDHRNLLEELHARLLAAPLPAAELRATEPPAAAPVTEPPDEAEAPPFVEPPDFYLEAPVEGDPVEQSTAPDFEDIFRAPQERQENFLSRARRTVRAAPQKPRPRYLFPVLVGLVTLLALAAGLILSGRVQQRALPKSVPQAQMRTFSLPEPPEVDDTQFVVAPQAGGHADDFSSQRSEPSAGEAPPRTVPPLQQREVRSAPVNPVPDAASAPSPHVIQLANSGDATALTVLGLHALDGAPVSLPDALKYLTQAAEKGQPVAQYRLGTLYERGQGVPVDAAKAAHWYELAANQGNRKAMHNLAVFYAGGAAGKKNMSEAALWFAKASALGLSDSQFNLAVLYERGDGVPQSLVDAFKWYSIAAAAGDPESRTRIGVLQTQLSDTDKAAAAKAVVGFHAMPLDHAANVPPDAKGL